MMPAPDADAQLAGLGIAVVMLDPQGAVAALNPAAEALVGHSRARIIGTPLDHMIRFADETLAAHIGAAEGYLTARDIAATVGGAAHRFDLTVSEIGAGWRVMTLMAGPELGARSAPEKSPPMPSILAHEVKNPLAAIRGAAQLLARQAGEEGALLTSLITGEVDRIAELLDRMQRLDTRQAAPTERFNLHAALRSALATIRASEGLGAIQFHERFDPSLPDVSANRAALEQVLINLLANACDAVAAVERPVIELRTGISAGATLRHSGAGGLRRLPAELTIADNGPGIAPDMADRMFEPFVTSKPHGQGLGLPLAQKLMHDMGGHLTCQRDNARGLTLFRLHLPIAPVETAEHS